MSYLETGELLDKLRQPEIKQLICSIDNAPDPYAALEKARESSKFAALVDELLG